MGYRVMDISVIIGNPPYQDSKNKQIYPYFMQLAFNLSNRYVTLIVKNDWLAISDITSDKIYILS